MAPKIIVPANKVWDYYTENRISLMNRMDLIASNEDFGMEIYIMDDGGIPSILVFGDSIEYYEETVLTADDCVSTVQDIYNTYLEMNAIDAISDSGYENEITEFGFALEDEIDRRELQLDDAVSEFIDVATDYFGNIRDSVVDDVKEHILEYLYKKHGLKIYRPMFLEFEDGSEEFFEYPYENMEFDD